MQLAETLNIDQSDSCDFDKMVTKVCWIGILHL